MGLLENLAEGVKTDAPAARVVVLLHDFLQVFLRDLLAKLAHSRFDVQRGYIAIPFSIELLEDGHQALVGDDLLNGDGGGEELRIVNFILSVIFDLVDNAVDFLLLVVDLGHLEGCSQIAHGDVARLVLIHAGESTAEDLDVLGVGGHLNQDI